MAKRTQRARKAAGGAGGRGYLPWVLLALSCAVIALAVYIYLEPPDTPTQPSKESTGEYVRALAEQLMRGGQYAQAADLMASWVKANPGDAPVLALLAEAQFALRRYDDAEASADRALALSANYPEALWWKGRALQRRGDEAYLEYFRKAAESPVGPRPRIWALYGYELLVRQHDRRGGEAYLRRAYEAGERDPQTLRLLAGLAMEENRFQQAEELLREALRTDRNDVGLHVLLAEAQKNGGKFNQAVRTLRSALLKARGKDKPGVWMKLGQALILQKKTAEAAEAYAQAGDYPEFRLPAATEAARCYFDLKRYARAMEQIDRAAGVAPHDPNVAELKKQIEDARFGKPKAATQPGSAPSILLPRYSGQ